MITDIWQAIMNVTQEKLGYPLREIKGEGADDLIRELAKEYGSERLQAMWLYYIGSSTERGYGISVEAFSEPRRLSKYAGMVTKVKKFQSKVDPFYGYTCEYNHLYREDLGWYRIPEGENVPPIAPDPCPVCGGRCYLEGDIEFILLGKPWDEYEGTPEHRRTMKHFTSLRQVYQDEIINWERRTDWQRSQIDMLRRSKDGTATMDTAVREVPHADGGEQRGEGDMRQLPEVAEAIAADRTKAGIPAIVEQTQEKTEPDELGDLADSAPTDWF